jgi:hypothetical protein
MNLYNPNSFTYKHSFDSRRITIAPKSVYRGLTGAQFDHFTKHNPTLKYVDDIEAEKLESNPQASASIYQCDHCQKICKNKLGLQSHMRSHVTN